VVVPVAAGGGVDVMARLLAQKLSERLGQQFTVENRAGAAGVIGTKAVIAAPADGTTLLYTPSSLSLTVAVHKAPPYDVAKDVAPIINVAVSPYALVVHPSLPAHDLKEFIAYAKANQAKMQYGSAGAGSATHLGCVLLNHLIGVDITHVPYRGTGPAMQDLQGGRIDYLCEVISTAKPQIDGGTVNAIAIKTKERSPALPNVPTGLEQGTPNLEAYTWNALFLPKGASAEIVKKLNDATVEAMKTPSVRERLAALGAVIVSPDRATPEYLAGFLKSEIEKWAGPIKASGVTVD
jgi:tripartite-type tricarboxylate transporter receptor subunit TctC